MGTNKLSLRLVVWIRRTGPMARRWGRTSATHRVGNRAGKAGTRSRSRARTARVGLGRIVALYHRSSTLYHYYIRYLFIYLVPLFLKRQGDRTLGKGLRTMYNGHDCAGDEIFTQHDDWCTCAPPTPPAKSCAEGVPGAPGQGPRYTQAILWLLTPSAWKFGTGRIEPNLQCQP